MSERPPGAAIITAAAETGQTTNAQPQHPGLETELKLLLSGEDLARLKRHPLLRSWKFSGTQELVSIYLDTKGHILGRQGLSVRLRRKGGQILRTTKEKYRGILDRS